MSHEENELSPEELERLSILMEEMGESIQMIGKIQRHGYFSYHPKDPATSNKKLLEKELAHVFFAVEIMQKSGDIESGIILKHMEDKRKSIKDYVHFHHEGL